MSEGLRDEIASLRAELAEVNKVDHDARCPDLLCKNLETAANLRAQLAGAAWEIESDEWKARAEKAEAALKAGRVEAARMWRLLERLDDQCAEGGAGAIQAIHIELHAVLAFRDAARGEG